LITNQPSLGTIMAFLFSGKDDELVRSVLITGANAGLGKEVARQLAVKDETVTKVFLACRNETKAVAAQRELERETSKQIFEVVIMDMSNPDSIRAAVSSLSEPIDALLMNAGGPLESTPNNNYFGALETFAANVLGHMVLMDELMASRKLKKTAVFVGSEAARGAPMFQVKCPTYETGSVDELKSVVDGTFFGTIKPSMNMQTYAQTKLMGALWMSSAARKHPNMRLLTMSPGATAGTEAVNNITPPVKKFMFKTILTMMAALGRFNKLEAGAARLVDALINTEAYQSGAFYASASGMAGEVGDQSPMNPWLSREDVQDNAYEALHCFIK